jgi:hypothetical protein
MESQFFSFQNYNDAEAGYEFKDTIPTQILFSGGLGYKI